MNNRVDAMVLNKIIYFYRNNANINKLSSLRLSIYLQTYFRPFWDLKYSHLSDVFSYRQIYLTSTQFSWWL